MSVSTAPAETSLADRCAATCHDAIALVGRLAMSWIFLSSGFGKLTDVAAFSAGLAKRGVPAPSLMGWLGAIVEFGGGIGVISCLANRRIGQRDRHIVVEANPHLIPLLEKNRSLNRCAFTVVN